MGVVGVGGVCTGNESDILVDRPPKREKLFTHTHMHNCLHTHRDRQIKVNLASLCSILRVKGSSILDERPKL